MTDTEHHGSDEKKVITCPSRTAVLSIDKTSKWSSFCNLYRFTPTIVSLPDKILKYLKI